MSFHRASILRSAHAATRRRMAPSSSWRYGDIWNPEASGWVPKSTYREIFRAALSNAWADAKAIAEEAAWAASQPQIPDDVAERVQQMRIAAWYEPITTAGNARMKTMMAEAADLAEAVRINAVPEPQLVLAA